MKYVQSPARWGVRGRSGLSAARCVDRRTSTPVLIVLNPDGAVEVYGQQLRLHFAQRLDVGPAEQGLADDYLDLTLPPPWRGLYWPRNLAGTDVCQRRSALDEIRRRTELAVLRELRGLRQAMTPAAVIAKMIKRRAG